MTTITEAMGSLRAALLAVEHCRTGTSALVKAARGNDALAAAMAPLIQTSVEGLSVAMAAADAALALVVQAASPAPVKPEPTKEKPAKAA